MKDREQLAAINPYSDSMLLTTLHWPDEIRPIEELAVDSSGIEIKASERKMAEQLIASMTAEFSAEEFRDDYRQALMGVIEAKVAGEEPTPIAATEPTKIGDLMAALEASVAAAREARRDAAAGADAEEESKPTAARRSRAKKSAEAEEAPRPGGARPPERRRAARTAPASRRAGGREDRSRLPDRIAPMQPAEADAPFDDADYLFEPWWPGARAIAFAERGRVRLQVAGLADAAAAFPELVELTAQLAEDGVAVDGTLLVLDPEGRPDADLLRSRLTGSDRRAGRAATLPPICCGPVGSRL